MQPLTIHRQSRVVAGYSYGGYAPSSAPTVNRAATVIRAPVAAPSARPVVPRSGVAPIASAPSSVGIGIITYNRLATLQACVEAVQKFTTVPYRLVVADDGSQDGSAQWCIAQNIPVVTGDNLGCAWNKNRALYYLLERTDCETLILLEDDTHPCSNDWAQAWTDAARRWGIVNFARPGITNHVYGPDWFIGQGTPDNPYWARTVTAQCRAARRDVSLLLGYLDSRFAYPRSWGSEHVEHDHRGGRICASLGLWPQAPTWPPQGQTPDHHPYVFPSGDWGLELVQAGTWFEPHANDRNYGLFQEIVNEGDYRPPARDAMQWHRLRQEHHANLQERQRRANVLSDGALSPVPDVSVAPSTMSVIITTGDDPLRLRLTLLSLLRQGMTAFQTLVVNDGGTGATERVVAELQEAFEARGLSLRTLYFGPPKSPDAPFRVSAARNFGARHARGDVLLFCDSDIVLDPGNLRAHGQAHRQARCLRALAVAFGFRRDLPQHLVGPELEGASLDRLQAASTPDPRLSAEMPVSAEMPAFGYAPYIYAWGFNLSMSRALFERAGGYDESFVGWGYEDTELGLRLARAKVAFLPLTEAQATHLGHPSRQASQVALNGGLVSRNGVSRNQQVAKR